MGLGDLVNSIGDGAEHLAEGAEHLAGSAVEGLADGAGDALNAVGLHSAAQGVEHFGDGIADDLGASVAEAQLGDSDDPKDLVHGDAGAITKTADSLRRFKSGFEDAYQALSQLETDDWQGQAAEAFHAKYLEHPKRWSDAADACGQAATALDTYAQTVTWAQGQAKQAVEDYKAAKQATDAHNKQVDQYNQAAEGYNYLVSHHDSLPAGATKPVPPPSEDPGAAGRAQAQQLLNAARKQRDQAADAAARAISAAMALAPKEPSFLQRMYNDGHDLVQDAPTELLHFYGGIAKGAVGIVNFARDLNPLDPYNLTHPATYLDGLSTTAAGLVHAANNPTVLLKSLVGSGWSSDPAQALGNLIPNIALAVATDGGGTAADAAADAGERAAVGAGEDAGEDAASQAARQQAENPHAGDATSETGDPVDVATGRMTLSQTDVALAGVLPLEFARTFNSGHRAGIWMGPGWFSTIDQRLVVDDQGVILIRDDGVRLTYPHPGADPADPEAPVHPTSGAAWPLRRHRDGAYTVTDPGTRRRYTFSPHRASVALLTEVDDPAGHTIAFDHDEAGVPTDIRHSGGYHLRLTTDQKRLTAIHLAGAAPDGADLELIRYGYSDGQLTEIIDSSGTPQRFAYDARGRIVSWTDRNGRSYHYAYDEADRCTAQGGEGGVLHYRYAYDLPDAASGLRATEATDSLGRTTRYVIDAEGLVVSETDPAGATVHTSWSAHDRPEQRTDALGRTIAYAYDEAGNVTEVTRPDGRTIRARHDEHGNPTEITEADGTVLCSEYDEIGNLVSRTDPTGAATRYTYDDGGHLAAVTDPLGATTVVECNAAGLPVSVTDPLGATTRYDRDAFGRVTAIHDPVGGTTCLEWTVEGRLAHRAAPDGTSESWTWDGEGNQLTHTDQLGQTTCFEYGPFDQPTARTDPDGTRHTFTYDTELQLIAVTNPQGLTWTYVYDAAGRLTTETDFNGRTLTYAYDAAGRLLTRTNALGEEIHHTYDALDRVTAKDADGARTTYAYDPAGRLTRAEGPDAVLDFTYDPLGRLLTQTSNGRTLSLDYDATGRRIRRTTPSGAISTWAYDPAGNLLALTTADRTLDFEHDALGRETARRLGGELTLRQTWDPAHRLRAQSLSSATRGALNERNYTYRPDGYLSARQDTLTGESSCTLDPAGRVTALQAATWTETYAYDQAGNLTEADWPARLAAPEPTGPRTYSGSLLQQAGRVSYTHDEQGRITLRRTSTLSGKQETWHYTWDSEDRLTGVTTPDGANWRYCYDPLGRRIAKQHLAGDGSTVLEQVDFTWDDTTLAEQTTRAPHLPGPHTLTWDHHNERPLTQVEQIDGPSETNRRFFAIITDLIGTPTELVDDSGNIAWHARTTLWGHTTWPKSSTTYTPLRFPGQYFDPETHLHYNLNRYYDPSTARYTSPDPLGLAPASNPYNYVHNPHTWTDPLGLAPGYGDAPRSKEVEVGPYQSFEQARNKALELLGPIDPATRLPNVGRLEAAQATYGKVTGFTTKVEGVYKQFRLDYDPVKGPHINVVVGRGAAAQKWAVRWEGTESDVERLLRRNA